MDFLLVFIQSQHTAFGRKNKAPEICTISGAIHIINTFWYFSFQFFKLSEDNSRFLYILNTQVARSKILTGLLVDPSEFLTDAEITEEQAIPQRAWLAGELQRLSQAFEKLNREYELYWIEPN